MREERDEADDQRGERERDCGVTCSRRMAEVACRQILVFDGLGPPPENQTVRDDDLRSSCFAALDVLQAKWGADIPYSALVEGFNFRGRRVSFLNRAFGIYRAAAQRGPAALSVNSSYKQDRYQDEQTPDGVLYRYQGDDCGTPTFSTCRWLFRGHETKLVSAVLSDVRGARLTGRASSVVDIRENERPLRRA